jgi:dipeptidyl aminopeptidase/acylaminoacyl peptidase
METAVKRTLILAVFTVSITSATAAQEQERRPMTTDDGLNMISLGNALMSPDGEWVFYSRSELDWKENKRKTTYHMVPAAGGESFQYVGEDGGSSFQFSPDGNYLAFRRTADSTQQLFLMRTTGGEAVQLTKLKSDVGTYQWANDSRRIFFVADESKSEEEKKRHKAGYDAIIVDEGPNGQQAASWNNLWVIDIEDEEKEPSKITDEEVRIGSFDVSPDVSRIVFTARYENRRNQQYLSEIFLFDIEDSAKTRLTENRAPENGVQWSPDGVHFAYRAVSNGEWEQRQNKLWVMNANTRETRMISGQFVGNISQSVWTPDADAILFTGRQRTNSNLFRLDVSSGEVEQLTEKVGSLSASSFSRDRSKMVYSFQDIDTPADLFVSPTANHSPTRLTTANPWIESEIILGMGEVVSWKSSDGLDIEGILYLPDGYERGTRIPLLLHVHGGPAGVFSNSFSYRYHVWAGLGYAQLLPNVRGSSAYSDEFLRGNNRDIGGGDYQDLMTGVDHVIEEGYVDPGRIGIRGWSYGGILGGWTITQTDRFKGASLGAMVSDWTSEYGPGFNHDVRLWYIGDTPWENPDRWREMSPLTHVANVTTPTLLLHGINDRTDTEPQSMMFFTALKDQGKATRYIKFPREPHGFREPRHQRTRDIEEIKWIQQYVLGIDWTPWERAAEDEDDEEKKDTGNVSARR